MIEGWDKRFGNSREVYHFLAFSKTLHLIVRSLLKNRVADSFFSSTAQP